MVKKRLVVGIAAAALLLSAAGVGAANAVSYVNGGITRITTTYSTATHKLKVYDAYSDGWGGYADWATTEFPSSGRVTNTSGYGTSAYSGYIAGPGHIIYNACAKNGSVTIGCSGSVSSLIN